jgi:hypothetical protein
MTSENSTTIQELLAALKDLRSEPRLSAEFDPPKYVHRIPQRPTVINGTKCRPRDIRDFDGMPLYYVLDESVSGTPEAVAVFSDLEKLRNAVGAVYLPGVDEEAKPGSRAAAAAERTTLGGYVDLYEHKNFGGAKWTFWASWGPISNFTRVYPTLWWTSDINDLVSSMDANVNANPVGTVAWSVLYEHIDFRGEQLWTSNREFYPPDTGGGVRSYLGDIWNDRASSLAHGYSI